MAKVIGVLYEPVWKQKKMNRKTKLRAYNAIVVRALMYGREMWALRLVKRVWKEAEAKDGQERNGMMT